MSRETELDDLELDKLLEDDDFLEDFDFDDLSDNLQEQEEEPVPEVERTVGTPVTNEPVAVEPGGGEQGGRLAVLQPLFFLLAVGAGGLLLILQFYLALGVFRHQPIIRTGPREIAIADIITRQLSELEDEELPAEVLPPEIVAFRFHYPLYSLHGLQVLGVDVKLCYVAGETVLPSPEQVKQLKQEIHGALAAKVDGRLLDELGDQPEKLFDGLIWETLIAVLEQWNLQPDRIDLENLLIH
ncbi:MAG: hypothetical protein JXO49_11805 [Deltaproteobacteria bacterium]|nr:hypothetical protein [Candidatus Anaeroferrophillus wilburensis]MBN2890017.1 hypothetical protein [Deltaproteobacteria bacterium]